MKTFTLDPYIGELNPEVQWIEAQTREKLKDVVADFVKNCIENGIETTSASGLFYEMTMQELTMARSCYISKHKKGDL